MRYQRLYLRGRQRFRCTACGLLVEGRQQPDGRVLPYDRAPYDGSPERPALCVLHVKEADNA